MEQYEKFINEKTQNIILPKKGKYWPETVF